jgi:hypothetical protein
VNITLLLDLLSTAEYIAARDILDVEYAPMSHFDSSHSLRNAKHIQTIKDFVFIAPLFLGTDNKAKEVKKFTIEGLA